jgi:hypothetical protein
MQAHLLEISAAVEPGAHAVLLLDRAGCSPRGPAAMPYRPWLLALAVGLVIVLAVASISRVDANHFPNGVAQDDQRYDRPNQEDHSAYGVIAAGSASVGAFLNRHAAAINAVATLVIAGFTGILWWATISANYVAARAFDASSRPILVVDIGNVSKDWRASDDPMFEILNVGTGAGIVTKLCRSWQVVGKVNEVRPITPGEKLDRAITKENEIAIGPGRRSGAIRMRSDLLRNGSPLDGRHTFFMGYIEYRDLAGNRFISGFCHIYDSSRPEIGFHFAWPNKDARNYNYHRSL